MDAETKRKKADTRQQSQDALRVNEELLRSLVDSAPVGVFLTDVDGQCRYVNQMWCKMAGMKREEALGDGWFNALHPDDRERVRAQWNRLSLSNWNWQQEYRFQAPNGKVTWISAFASDIRDEQGYVVGYFGINMDNSAQKSMEAALRTSEERYRTTIDALRDGIHVVDHELKITMNNSTIARWAQEMGLSGILVGKTPFKAFPFLPASVADEYQQVFQTGEILITNEESHFANREKHLEVRKIPIMNRGQVSHIATVIRDVSKQMQAEKALKESEEHLRLALEGAVADSWEMNLETGSLTYSDRWAMHMGYKPGEIDQNMESIQKIVHPDDLERTFIDLNAYLDGKTALYETECRLRRKNGEYVWILSRGKAVARDQTGKPIRLIGTNFDVNERKRAEETLRRQAREMDALQKTVLEIVEPHELSTLLPTIVERAVNLLGGAEGGLYLSDPLKKEVRCVVSYNTKRDYTGTVLKFGEGAAGTVAQNGKPLIIDDYRIWPGRATVFESEQPFISILSVPLWWQGQVIGVLHVLNDVEGETFSKANQDLLSMFAAHAAMAVGKAQALEQTENEIAERKQTEDILATRLRISEFAPHHSQDELLQLTLDEAERLTGSSIGFLHFVDDDQIHLHLQMWSTNTLATMCTIEGKGKHYPVDEAGVWVDCLLQKKPVIHNDYESLKHKKGYPDGHAPVTRELTVPVVVGDKVKAIIGVGNKETKYDDNDVKIVSALAHMVWDIVERKQAEEALRESQKNLQAILDANLDSALLVEPDGQIVTCNETVAKRFGKKKEDLFGTNTYDLVDAQVAEHRRGYAEQVVASGEAVRFEDERNGRVIDNSIYPVFDESGQVVRLALYGKDITERRHLFHKLQESEHNLNIIFNTMTEGLALNEIVYDENGEMVDYRILKVNPAFYTTADYSGTDVEGNLATRLYGLSRDFIKTFWKEHLERNTTAHTEIWSPLNNQCFYISTSPFMNDKFVTSFFDITERKRAEEKLRESEERHKLLAETMSDYVYSSKLYPDGSIVTEWVTGAFKNITGYTFEELIENGPGFVSIVNPDDINTFAVELSPKMQNLEPVISEYRITTKDGSVRWLRDITKPISARTKDYVRLIGAVQDITKRVQAEQEIRKTKTLLERTFASLDQAVFVIDKKDRKVLSCNQAAENIFGYGQDEMIGHTTEFMYVDQASYEDYFPEIRSALDRESVYRTEMQMRRKDGTHFWADVTDTELLDDKGRRTGVVSVIRDVTERVQTEGKIRESEERYRLLAENSTDGIILYSADYVPLYTSPSLEKLTGYPLVEFEKYYVFDLFHPDDRERVLQAIQRDVQQKKRISKHEFKFKKKDDSYAWFETLGNRSFDEIGNVTQILVNIRDITERKRSEQEREQLLEAVTYQREELRALNTRVAEADEIERRRIASELHDQIGQNMSALSINLNIIESQISEDKELAKRVVDSLHLVDETADTIRDVMADLHPTILDDYGLFPALNWLAERVEQRTDLQINVKSYKLPEERLEPKVEMNLFRITQEALNNVSRHAGAKKVEIELKQLKKFLRLSVTDDGTGFDVSAQQESDDHGWGLRIMRERAESIGGRFRVESEAGNGARVVVELDV